MSKKNQTTSPAAETTTNLSAAEQIKLLKAQMEALKEQAKAEEEEKASKQKALFAAIEETIRETLPIDSMIEAGRIGTFKALSSPGPGSPKLPGCRARGWRLARRGLVWRGLAWLAWLA